MVKATQDEWEKYIKEYMKNKLWTLDEETETHLCFSIIEGDAHWMRDYNRKERRFVQMNGNLRINLTEPNAKYGSES